MNIVYQNEQEILLNAFIMQAEILEKFAFYVKIHYNK